jgi:hypothetical protein
MAVADAARAKAARINFAFMILDIRYHKSSDKNASAQI